MKPNKFKSFSSGKLPKGCTYCVKGQKLVLFVTGVCPRKCYFCPISDEKYGEDVTFANERVVKSKKDVLREAELMDAKGAGITGGDPLARIERTASLIKRLKEKFDRKFHIHLYTSLNLVTENALKQLHDAGLDEIRFHLDLDSKKLWNKVDLARKFNWGIGVEVPLVPGKEKELKGLIDFIHSKVDFLNLNELEVADNAQSRLLELGFKTRSKLSYGVKGSVELGLNLMEYAKKKKYKLHPHICTAQLKDSVQLANRIKREAKGVKRKFDVVDDEGLLTRGALYLEELVPGFGYRKKLKCMDKAALVSRLRKVAAKVRKIDPTIFLDKEKPRILLSSKSARKYKTEFKEIGLIPTIVKEYPTADQLEVEVEFL